MLRTLLMGMLLVPAVTHAAPGPEELYQSNCLACHGENRLGAMAPALLPESLGRLKKSEAIDAIANGRVATQMPGFKDKLSAEQISQLAEWIYQPMVKTPAWGELEISASRIAFDKAGFQDKPVFTADPMNVFLVVEAGDHHISVLDGDKLCMADPSSPRTGAMCSGPRATAGLPNMTYGT